MKGCSLLLPAVLAVVAVVSASAQRAADVPVVSSLLGVADDPYTIRSDGGPYTHTAKGTKGVESHIQSGGSYELDMYYFTSERRLSIDLNHVVPGTATANAPTGVMLTRARLITKCDAAGNMLTMDPTQPLDSCALHGRFDYYGRTMLIRMDPAGYPNTRKIRVVCTGTDPRNPSACANWKILTCSGVDEAGQCTQWGQADGVPFNREAHVMTVLEEVSTKGGVKTTRVGDYYVQLEIHASKP